MEGYQSGTRQQKINTNFQFGINQVINNEAITTEKYTGYNAYKPHENNSNNIPNVNINTPQTIQKESILNINSNPTISNPESKKNESNINNIPKITLTNPVYKKNENISNVTVRYYQAPQNIKCYPNLNLVANNFHYENSFLVTINCQYGTPQFVANNYQVPQNIQVYPNNYTNLGSKADSIFVDYYSNNNPYSRTYIYPRYVQYYRKYNLNNNNKNNDNNNNQNNNNENNNNNLKYNNNLNNNNNNLNKNNNNNYNNNSNKYQNSEKEKIIEKNEKQIEIENMPKSKLTKDTLTDAYLFGGEKAFSSVYKTYSDTHRSVSLNYYIFIYLITANKSKNLIINICSNTY